MTQRSTNIASSTTSVALLAASLVFLSACAAQQPRPRGGAPLACSSGRVLYCVESGSRAEEGTCRCLSQDSAQTSLENL